MPLIRMAATALWAQARGLLPQAVARTRSFGPMLPATSGCSVDSDSIPRELDRRQERFSTIFGSITSRQNSGSGCPAAALLVSPIRRGRTGRKPLQLQGMSQDRDGV